MKKAPRGKKNRRGQVEQERRSDVEQHDTNQGETAEGSAAHRESVRLGEVVDAVGALCVLHGAADVLWALAQNVEDSAFWPVTDADCEELQAMARRWAVFAALHEVVPEQRSCEMLAAVGASVAAALVEDFAPKWRLRVAHAALVMAGIAEPTLEQAAKLVRAMR